MSTLRTPDTRARLDVPAKECRVCQKPFFTTNSLTIVCGLRCAQRIPAFNRKAEKAERKADKAKLEAHKPRSKWLKETQAEVNRYARLRDIRLGYGCVTCGARFGNRYGGAFDAGHMHSRGSSPHLRFHLHNLALQCVKDNRFLGGLALQFRDSMVARHGIEKIEALETIQGPAKHSIDYLRRLKRVFAKKANRMEKRLDLQN